MPSIKDLEKLPKWTSNLYIIGLGHQDPNTPNEIWKLPTTAHHSLGGYNSYRRWSSIDDFVGSLPAHHFSISSSYHPEIELLKEVSKILPEYECAIASVSSIDTGGSSDTYVQYVKNGEETSKQIFKDFSNPRIALLLSYSEKVPFDEWFKMVQKWWELETSPEGEYNIMYLQYHEQFYETNNKISEENTNFIHPLELIVSKLVNKKINIKESQNEIHNIFEILLYLDIIKKNLQHGNVINLLSDVSKTGGKEIFFALDDIPLKSMNSFKENAKIISEYYKNGSINHDSVDLTKIQMEPAF